MLLWQTAIGQCKFENAVWFAIVVPSTDYKHLRWGQDHCLMKVNSWGRLLNIKHIYHEKSVFVNVEAYNIIFSFVSLVSSSEEINLRIILRNHASVGESKLKQLAILWLQKLPTLCRKIKFINCTEYFWCVLATKNQKFGLGIDLHKNWWMLVTCLWIWRRFLLLSGRAYWAYLRTKLEVWRGFVLDYYTLPDSFG